jgi:predicted nucleic acid-binding protein
VTVFVDTAVLMYAGGANHPLRAPCLSFLSLVVEAEIPAVTSVEVVQEILHRFTAIRLPDTGAAMAEETLDLFAPVLPVTHAVMQRMPELTRRYPTLVARDLVHVATCAEEGVRLIVSIDRGFDAVVEVTRVDPADEQAIAALLA